MGRRAWADLENVAVEEVEGRITWQRPNALLVDLEGRRNDSRIRNLDLTSEFERPLFVPRGLSDSVRIFGARTPAVAAPHPLSAGAAAHYRYAAGAGMSLMIRDRVLTVREVTFTPQREGPSYLAGKMWLDVSNGDLVRIAFRFVGTGQWERVRGQTRADTVAAERTNSLAGRVLQVEADLEYALEDGKYWMPYRQVVTGRVTLPFGLDLAIPFRASTTFSQYQINQGAMVVFTAALPDSIRGIPSSRTTRGRGSLKASHDSLRARTSVGKLAGGGKYQINIPPEDSLRAFTAWDDSLKLEDNPLERRRIRSVVADLAAISESLPGVMVGRPGAHFGVERLAEVLRYNRVEGTTVTLGGSLPLGVRYGQLSGLIRYGLADQRVMARLNLLRDTPDSRTTLSLGRDLTDQAAFGSGLSLGNSLTAALSGRDDAAYFLGQGIRLRHERSVGLGSEMVLTAIVEDQRSVNSEARATLPRIFGADGVFPANPPIREGLALGGGLRLDHGYWGTRWSLDLLALTVDGKIGARAAVQFLMPDLLRSRLDLRMTGGVAAGADRLPQVHLSAGGQKTVRGFDYATMSGSVMWATQLTWHAGSGVIQPILFVDAGQAGDPGRLGHTPTMTGVGGGLSLLGGLVQANLSYPVHGAVRKGLRFELSLGGLR